MISVTKIFRFEMGHAIDEYEGPCRYIHGHSYVLHVTVATKEENSDPLPPPGFVIDFKVLKKMVMQKVISRLDHALVLSEQYIQKHPHAAAEGQNLLIWPYEPSAENILYFVRQALQDAFRDPYVLLQLRLWETSNAYAEWKKSP